LFMWTPNGRSAGCMQRLDPDGNNGYALRQEACLGELFGNTLQVEPVYTLGAYNNIVSVPVPGSAQSVRLIGFQTMIKDHGELTWNRYYRGAMYAIRTADQKYRLAEVNGPYAAGNPTLVAPRTFTLSPFAEDEPRTVYVGGFDSNFQVSTDRAWIFRAPLRTVLSGRAP
jgi:hypothetical protein